MVFKSKRRPDEPRGFMKRLQVHAMILYRLVRAVTFGLVCTVCVLLCMAFSTNASESIPKWSRIEIALTNNTALDRPAQEIQLSAEFKSPSGKTSMVDGFWDGGLVWRIRFSPGEIGEWRFATQCPVAPALDKHGGSFRCIQNTNQNRFAIHGPVKVTDHGRALAHEDGTPFFWMADVAWNAPATSKAADWKAYLKERARQNFTAIQWSAAPWSNSLSPDHTDFAAFSGRDKISINPEYFKQLDGRMDEINAAGLLAAPALLGISHSNKEPNHPDIHSDLNLPEDQAILLARYMVARWGANSVLWILDGNGADPTSSASRCQHIGRATFGDRAHAPIAVLIGTSQALLSEKWMDIIGCEIQVGTNDASLNECFSGPQARFWTNQPTRPVINLGPMLERAPFDAADKQDAAFVIRRAMYWSLLSGPTAGVTYGNQATLDWFANASTGTNQSGHAIPQTWKTTLSAPAAEQMAHLVKFFMSIQYSHLRPAQDMLATNPGLTETRRHIAAARTQEGDLAVIYVPEDRSIQIRFKDLPPSVETSWTDPRNGLRRPVIAVLNGENVQFTTPGPGDWLLLLKSEIK
jgi:hypothetical protein